MNEERIAQVYGELESYVVELDPNPAERGPGYLQDLISKTRGYLNNTSVHLSQVLREIHIEEMALEALEAAFQVQSDEMMANNRSVSTLPAVQDRLAMVNVLLAAERRAIAAKKRVVKNLHHVQKVVRHRQKELDNTMASIRLQRSLLETEIRTGSFYGDEGEASRGTRWPQTPGRQAEDVDSDEIARLMREAEGLVEDKAPPPAASTETEISSLLEQVDAYAAEDTQPVVAGDSPDPNRLEPPVEVAADEDPDVLRFLSPDEPDIDELLKGV